MKSPREILLERHRQAEAKLDEIRENVVVNAKMPAVGCRVIDAGNRGTWNREET